MAALQLCTVLWSRLARLLLVLCAVDCGGAGQSSTPPAAELGTGLDSVQLLRLVVHDVTTKVDPQFRELNERVQGLSAVLISFDTRLNGIDRRLTGFDFKLDSFDVNLKELITKVDTADNKHETNLNELVSRVDSDENRLDSILSELASSVRSSEGRQEELISRMDTSEARFNSKLRELVSRVNTSERRHDSGLDELYSRANFTDVRLDSRLDELTSRLDALAAGQSGRLDGLSSRLDGLSARLDGLSSRTGRELDGPGGLRSRRPPRDCSELPAGAPSGIYPLQLGLNRSGPVVPAYCDIDADGHGWTVIQRRADVEPRLDFNRDWSAYKQGFGELDSEFWWGLEKLWQMTGPRDRQYQLRVELADFEGERRHAVYQQFRVASGANGYRLTVDDYNGDAGDSLKNHNGKKFSTKDRDQDGYRRHCAEVFSGGWWFSSCYQAYLNGLYLKGEQETRTEGVNWGSWRGYNYSLKESEMKIRPISIA